MSDTDPTTRRRPLNRHVRTYIYIHRALFSLPPRHHVPQASHRISHSARSFLRGSRGGLIQLITRWDDGARVIDFFGALSAALFFTDGVINELGNCRMGDIYLRKFFFFGISGSRAVVVHVFDK